MITTLPQITITDYIFSKNPPSIVTQLTKHQKTTIIRDAETKKVEFVQEEDKYL